MLPARIMPLLLVLPAALAQSRPAVVKPWFTDAELPDSTTLAAPSETLPAAPGTAGSGVLLTRAMPIENPLLDQEQGLISFWICPHWDGDDGARHQILHIGDPVRNGLLVEKSARGMLRYVMASPARTTAARADVSKWKAGEWHQVVIAWMSRENRPLGMPLWIDRVAVDGPVAGENQFLDPDEMSDARVWIGDETSAAVLDELIMRDRFDSEGPHRMTAVVYRDYFRTAPYTRIRINPEALRVFSDRRVVDGHQKQFGLLAEMRGRLVPVTDYLVRYGQWAEFDAKPLITWQTSDESIATVDENGRVTGHSVGQCLLTAEFRGMRDTYELDVIPVEQPDLDLLYVARLPRLSTRRTKWWPDPGEEVESVAYIENFGFKAAPAGTIVRFELLPDANCNFLLDPDEGATDVQEQIIADPLEPRQRKEVRFKWLWRPEPTWVRVTLDPGDAVSELCEANNSVCELSTARPLEFAYNPERAEPCYTERKINHVGSFSYPDWIRGQMQRFELLIREQVGPETSPNGIEDSFRLDGLYALQGRERWREEPYERESHYYDGGFPVNERVDLMSVDAAILHEFGHTVTKLPDLYGYPVKVGNVFLKDENGQLYAGGPLLPVVVGDDTLMLSPPNGVPCGVGYDSLMNHCHMWLYPAHAGQVQHVRGYRADRFWGVQGRFMPTHDQILAIYDINDEPLAGAAVYVYHVTQTKTRSAVDKYFHDRPKFMGHTNRDGWYEFPHETDRDWDDPDTDEVEGKFQVWNPFGRACTLTGAQKDVAFTPNVWQVEGLLLVKIVSGDQTEFHWLPLTEFNTAYFRGQHFRGVLPIYTSLEAAEGETPLVRPGIPEAVRETNLRPVAVAPDEVEFEPGEEFTIDGSESHDPEGQPLMYFWEVRGRGVNPRESGAAVYRGKAGEHAEEVEIVFWVNDGLRASEPIFIKARVAEEKPDEGDDEPNREAAGR